jgi:ferredoxin
MTDPDAQTDTKTQVDASDEASSRDGKSSNDSVSSTEQTHTVAVRDGDAWHDLEVEHGRTLRSVLREHNLSPHGWLTRHVNCNGQGHCSACAVEVDVGAGAPDQWLDRFLDENGIGRLSCQVEVTQDMAVRV